MTARIGRPARRAISAALWRSLAASTSTHGSNEDWGTVERRGGDVAWPRPAAGAADAICRNTRRELRMIGRQYNPAMSKKLLVASLAISLLPLLHAQGRAPENESIRQDDLRADLFFLAGDSLRGRLTDTEENRAAADYIRSRFERMGLKPAAPGGSYFQ